MKNYIKRITSWVLLLAIVVGATSFTNFDNVNAKEAPLTPQEPTVLNEENAQDTATQTLGSDPQYATFITKDGRSIKIDLTSTYSDEFTMAYNIKPTYLSIDSTGQLIYKEGTSCLSITDHGLLNHSKVHLWNDNSGVEIKKNTKQGEEGGYKIIDSNGQMGVFQTFEVTDEGYNVPHKYLRGFNCFDRPNKHPWQIFDFDIIAIIHELDRYVYLVRWRNYGSNLPIGLKDEASSKNGNEVETKDADAPDLWAIQFNILH